LTGVDSSSLIRILGRAWALLLGHRWLNPLFSFFWPAIMTQPLNQPSKKRSFTPFGIVSTLVGLALFTYFVNKAGVSQILEGIEHLYFGFLLVIAISALRQASRSIAWKLCVEPPYRLRFWDAFRARLMGDAIGNIVPFVSFMVAEPSKPVLIRDRIPLMVGFSALAIENIFYSMSVAVFILSGMLALLFNFQLPKGLRIASIVIVGIIIVLISLGCVLISKQARFVSAGTTLLHRRGLHEKWVVKARAFEDRIYGFYQRNRPLFLPLLALEACFHLAGVLEIYVVLWFISPNRPPTFFTAFILESVNRVINVAFKFIPLRMGVDEAGTGKISKVLQFAEVTGVTLAIIRKARDVFWAGVGMILLLQRGLSLRTLARESKAALSGDADAKALTTVAAK
jgi:Lysylphosphatidylglycerol synthase TM region